MIPAPQTAFSHSRPGDWVHFAQIGAAGPRPVLVGDMGLLPVCSISVDDGPELYPALFATLAAALAARAVADRGNGRAGAMWAALGSMVALGIGATFKVFPLMLALPFAVLLGWRWAEWLILFTVPMLIFIVSAVPFLSTPAFVQGVLLNFEGIRLFSPAQIFAQPASLFILAYIALTLFLIMRPVSASCSGTPSWSD